MPQQVQTSAFSTATMRRMPCKLALNLRIGSFVASSLSKFNTVMGRFSQMIALDSCSTCISSSSLKALSKSTVTVSSFIWKPILLESKSFQHTKERICSPQCCCILSRRTAQSKVTSTCAPTSNGASHSCQMRPSFSLACSTFTPPILPLSLNCPPPSGKITV